MKIRLDMVEKQYVVCTGRSQSFLSFNTVYSVACELARRLARTGRQVCIPIASEIGSLAQYHQYQSLMSDYAQLGDSQVWLDDRTPIGVRKALQTALKSQAIVRLYYGNQATGEDWFFSREVVGKVSQSEGFLSVPSLVDETTGSAATIDTASVVKVVDLDRKVVLYAHSNFYQPPVKADRASEFEQYEGSQYVVRAFNSGNKEGWTVIEGFETEEQALRLLAFVQGKTNTAY